MSFTPDIIIRRTDLEKNRNIIEESLWDKNCEQNQHFNFLFEALKSKPISFPEIELVIIKPEYTTLNQEVRDLLDELQIDYRIDI